MVKLAWVALPLLLYAVYATVLAVRQRRAARHTLNVQTSVLLLVYLLTTAGLGLFWVANQQLPVFDLHYLFGYATLALVAVHLSFNLPIVLRYVRKQRVGKETTSRTDDRPLVPATVWRWLAALAAVVAAFFLGIRHGRKELSQGWSQASPASPAEAVAVVERYHALSSSSRGGLLARGPQVEWGARPPAFKAYPGRARLELPEAGALAGRPLHLAAASPADRGAFDLGALAAVLFAASGITDNRGGLALRASPSSGALFPTEVYVIVRDVSGVDPGVYHYDPEHHRLDVISNKTTDSDAPAIVVLTSIFRRTGFKYRDRAYRYAVADAGHLLENLRIAAAEAGLAARPLPRFDESSVAELVEVDGIEEGVLAMVPLSPGAPGFRGDDTPHPGPPPLALAPAPEAAPLGVTGMVHVATSLAAPESTPPAGLVALPDPVPGERAVLDVIATRRSHRRFAGRALRLDQLSALFDAAAQPALLSTAVRAHLVVSRVEGLAPGVYRYRPAEHALALTRAGELGADAGDAALEQDVIGGAAAVLILATDRAVMFAEGARGYRHAFLEAGMFSERFLLSASEQGLGACPVGAFYDEEAAELIGVSPAEEWVIHFAAVGVKAD